jgi:hypothetical protein
VERSGPDDARDDAPDDGWDDDAHIYPAAPIPAHERTWRHPSEIGQTAWTATEPPVTIGRGLLVTSGAIGSALGVAVLYLLLPAGAPSPSASPTVTSSVASLRPPAVTVAEEPAVSSMLLGEPTEVRTDGPGLTLPAPDTPSTVLVMSVEAPTEEPLSVAVAIEGAPYVVTTANALDSIGAIDLLGPGDAELTPRMAAELVLIEGDLAYLAPSQQMEVVSFAATATAEAGETVTVLADDPTEVAYVESGTAGGVPELDAGRIVEGTPVVDDQGALVALCTVVIDGDGAHVEFIPVVDPTTDPTTPTSSAADTEDPDDADIDVTDDGAVDGGGAATDPTSTSVAAGSVGADRPTTTTTMISTSASVTATTASPSTSGATSAPTAWAGLRFDGAPASAPLTVTGVVAGSPAMAAGVMVGERVTAIDGVEVSSVDDVVAAIKRHQPGEVMKLTLAARTTTTSAGSSGASGQSGQSATTSTTMPGSGQSAGSTGSTGSTGGSAGTRTISVVLAVYAPTV